ncbi:hypothetical protein A5893_13035 [Pedobacter psychrophilus]|uniref:HTH tetR-type domain-containing protein n=2 Tax=Pedobacter psychrophilus TaxID=1826909 RepID=A0A179DD24_9SPHI|nr:hypothetical protein A5893_13035 [Pedobacter psychrophilus]
MKLSRDEIIEKTIVYANQYGWAKTSVREISKEIGYSTIKIYSEFGDKDQLLQEIQKKGFRLLRDEYVMATLSKENPEEQLIEICLAHYRFALKHSRYYELMFSQNNSLCKSISPEILTQAAEPVKSVIGKIASSKNIVHFLHWFSLVHGFYEVAHKNLSKKEKEAEKVLEDIIHNFIKGIK